jgi:hypothetical protein
MEDGMTIEDRIVLKFVEQPTELITSVASLDTSDYTKMSDELFGDIPVSERIVVSKAFRLRGIHVGDVTTSEGTLVLFRDSGTMRFTVEVRASEQDHQLLIKAFDFLQANGAAIYTSPSFWLRPLPSADGMWRGFLIETSYPAYMYDQVSSVRWSVQDVEVDGVSSTPRGLISRIRLEVCLWHFSDLARCPTRVRNGHQNGHPPITLNLSVHAPIERAGWSP